jgi:hypothetical protein
LLLCRTILLVPSLIVRAATVVPRQLVLILTHSLLQVPLHDDCEHGMKASVLFRVLLGSSVSSPRSRRPLLRCRPARSCHIVLARVPAAVPNCWARVSTRTRSPELEVRPLWAQEEWVRSPALGRQPPVLQPPVVPFVEFVLLSRDCKSPPTLTFGPRATSLSSAACARCLVPRGPTDAAAQQSDQ